MYHSTSSRRTSPSPCEELSGSRRGPSEIGSPTSTRNPMADWQIRTKRPLRGPVREEAGPTLKNYITPTGLQRLKDEHRFLLSRERPAVVEVVAWAASNGDRSENADYLYGKRRLGQIDSHGKHCPADGDGCPADGRGPEGFGGNWAHGPVHEFVAHRGLHSNFVHGRNSRPPLS